MKILLAAGVFFPDVGGPAIHVAKIAERLVKEGFNTVVVAYGDYDGDSQFSYKVKRISRKKPKIIQWLFYFFVLFKEAVSANAIYAFDPTAAGLPACVTSWILWKPFLIRIGGDPIWEREAEMGRRLMPITDYYRQGLHKIDKPILFFIIKKIAGCADKIIVYNQFLKDFYVKYFSVEPFKISIIKNPVFKREGASSVLPSNPVIVFAGRFVPYKNLSMVINAFNNVRKRIGKGRLVLIGKGPEKNKLISLADSLGQNQEVEFIESLPQEKLFEKIRGASVAVGPALSEFNPNFILEALSFGKPVLLSIGHGLSVDLPGSFLFDPLDQKDFESKLERMLQAENYKQAVADVAKIDMKQTWEKVLDSHVEIIVDLTKKK